MRSSYVFAGLLVSDRNAAIDWYSRVFDAAPRTLPNDEEATWQLTETASLYVLVDPSRAGTGIATIVVEGLDEHLKGLRHLGIETEAVIELPGAGRKAVLHDPDGNTVSIVELGR